MNNGDLRAIGDEPVGPEQMLALAERSSAEALRQTTPSEVLMYWVWGAAWTIGFFGLWLTLRDDPFIDAHTAALWVHGGLLAAAVLVTAVHIGRRVHGLYGPSAEVGRRLGTTWLVAFASYALMMVGLGRLDGADDVTSMLSPLLACLIVGVIFMAANTDLGGVAFSLGAWILLMCGVAALVGDPAFLLVMSIGGGGGFLVAAVVARGRLDHLAAP